MKPGPGSTPLPAKRRQPTVRPERGPPTDGHFLLPVWGGQYVRQFLKVSLPTLLAPGNIPAVSRALPCQFTFLTNTDGARILQDHPGIRYLRGFCDVRMSIIDDIITGDNYSTTITLAFERGVRGEGTAALNTCFFFLVSDYVVADGSLANVLERMLAGASGVTAGNFQVTEDEAGDSFFDAFDNHQPAIAVPPRALVKWALPCLHPATLANMVNFPLCHSVHSNRLFWRVDENTLLGRFYLMHMICIRPELTDFTIGSSSDYSFIPEMCPSGNVHTMDDSDRYLVVEMQSRHHEAHFIRLGPVDRDKLVTSLAEWTTAGHRTNAHVPVVYHVGELPDTLPSVVAESAGFIEAIEQKLPAPQPHRDHPYWIGAITAHLMAVRRLRQVRQAEAGKKVKLEPLPQGYQAFLYRLRDRVFGTLPKVKRWHPRWADYEMIVELARRYPTVGQRPLLIVSNTPDIFKNWLRNLAPSVASLDANILADMTEVDYKALIGQFGSCLLVLRQSEVAHVSKLIGHVRPLLSSDGMLLIFAVNGHGFAVGHQFGEDMQRNIGMYYDPSMVIDEVVFVSANRLRWLSYRILRNTLVLTIKNRLYLPLAAVTGSVFLVLTLIANSLPRRTQKEGRRAKVYSSVGIVMHATSACAVVQPQTDRDLSRAARRFRGASARPEAGRDKTLSTT